MSVTLVHLQSTGVVVAITEDNLGVAGSTAVTIGAHCQQDFNALITQSTAQPGAKLSLYEVRITLPANSPLIVNCFAMDNQNNLVAANTVLHAQLVVI
jgi:hypothetical protein